MGVGFQFSNVPGRERFMAGSPRFRVTGIMLALARWRAQHDKVWKG
jgi:hypothetical protein